ncbi:nucleotidyltransferase domain-containing protein [Catenulispora pinisilvae]|uniref:nucleotidyltransferase domain-containing protein n=1 Tax=Catenulispora pinisilvae TaxID=2705253 RepID=UPI0018912221|nr:nucleotidyltransferase domain-containing protein [Catenulispora pinisilvae]
MFTASERDQMLRTLIERAEADPDVTGAVLLGSCASGEADRWSDLDLAFTVDGAARAGVAGVAEHWTDWLAAGPGVVHHWDLPTGTAQLIRVFLLPNGLELDLNFYPEGELVRRGPAWRPVFGDFADDAHSAGGADKEAWTPTPNPAAQTQEIGLTWHHLLHARTCVERGRDWQAEHWIGQARTHVIALACLRLGYPTAYAKGAHLLPAEVTDPLRGTLVRSLDADELRRALMVAVEAFDREMRLHDPALAERLRPLLAED